MSLIRKHALLLSVLSALMLSIAAPYLIPENPDSPVFRSGTLGALLIAASAFPVYQAFSRANRRMLISGFVFGWLFSAALGLGSELLIYDGLLHGMGSLIRRVAVPFLASPCLGGLCARMLMADLPIRHGERSCPPVWAHALLLFLCWLPVLLAFYPGMLNYDFATEYTQHLEGRYSNIHPLLHSALMNGIITLGEWMASRTWGVLLMSLLQMVCFSLALAYSCVFARRRGVPAWAVAVMMAFYALHPVFSVMSVSMTKDTLFAAAVLVFSLKTWEMIETPASFFANRRTCAFYVVLGVGSSLLRNNGVFALLLMFPALLITLRGFRRRVMRLYLFCGLGCAAVMGMLTLALHPESLPSFQLYSLPAQQLVRAYNSGTMSEEDQAEIRSWYLNDYGLVIHEHLADSAKGNLDQSLLQGNGGEFLALWARHAKTYAHEYLEAFLMLNVGSWYPDDLSHSTIYPDVSYNDKGYLQLQEYDGSEYGIETKSFLPAVRDFYERICRRNRYQRYPLLSPLFCTATPFWVLLLVCAKLFSRRRIRMLPALLGVLGLWLSYLFGPCTLPRYTLPLFCLAPVMLSLAFSATPKAYEVYPT